MTRQEFLEKCKKTTDEFLQAQNRQYLLQYTRNKRRERTGLLLAGKDEAGQPFVAWSKCNTRCDKFLKIVGVSKALERAINLTSVSQFFVDGKVVNEDYTFDFIDKCLPQSIRAAFWDFTGKACKYFRV